MRIETAFYTYCMYVVGFGWKNQTSKRMHSYMLSNSRHESATNISTQEIGVLCH